MINIFDIADVHTGVLSYFERGVDTDLIPDIRFAVQKNPATWTEVDFLCQNLASLFHYNSGRITGIQDLQEKLAVNFLYLTSALRAIRKAENGSILSSPEVLNYLIEIILKLEVPQETSSIILNEYDFLLFIFNKIKEHGTAYEFTGIPNRDLIIIFNRACNEDDYNKFINDIGPELTKIISEMFPNISSLSAHKVAVADKVEHFLNEKCLLQKDAAKEKSTICFESALWKIDDAVRAIYYCSTRPGTSTPFEVLLEQCKNNHQSLLTYLYALRSHSLLSENQKAGFSLIMLIVMKKLEYAHGFLRIAVMYIRSLEVDLSKIDNHINGDFVNKFNLLLKGKEDIDEALSWALDIIDQIKFSSLGLIIIPKEIRDEINNQYSLSAESLVRH